MTTHLAAAAVVVFYTPAARLLITATEQMKPLRRRFRHRKSTFFGDSRAGCTAFALMSRSEILRHHAFSIGVGIICAVSVIF